MDGQRDIAEVRRMDLEEIEKFNAILSMRSDYDMAYTGYHDREVNK